MNNRISLARSKLPLFLFIILDMLVSITSASLAHWFRFDYFETSFDYQSLVLIHAFLVVGCSAIVGVYQSWRGRSLAFYLSTVVSGWIMSFTLLVAFLVMTKSTENYSRLWLGTWIVSAIAITLFYRVTVNVVLRHLRLQGRNSKHVLLIGSGRNYYAIMGEMGLGNEWGYNLDVCLEYQNVDEVRGLLEKQLEQDDDFDECWLCLPLKDSAVVEEVMHALRFHTMDIRYMPGLRDIDLLNHKVTPIGGFYSLDLSCSPHTEWNSVVKRIEDVLVSSIILLFISPVMLAVALAVKLTSEGPVIFKQKRLGANGAKIEVYKFRSMKVHQEADGKVTQAVKNDARLTPVGHFLRKTSLDELPQFINVLEGKMSVVGPRPHALAHNEEYMALIDSYMKRHKVKPGITGLAQVKGYRGETDTLEKMQKRVEMDLKYINSWSVLLDLKIIFLTIFKGFTNSNAY